MMMMMMMMMIMVIIMVMIKNIFFQWYVHDDVIKWKQLRYWPFVRGIHRWPVNSPHKGQGRGPLIFPLICIRGWVNNREAGDLRRQCAHYDITAMIWCVKCGDVFHFPPHDDVMKLKHFPRYWPFVRGIHRSPVNSPHKGQWCGALMFSLICARINGWVNNREAGDLRRHQAHCGVIVMTHWYYHSWYYRSEWIIAAVIQLGISLNGTVVKSATDLAIFVNPILYAFYMYLRKLNSNIRNSYDWYI